MLRRLALLLLLLSLSPDCRAQFRAVVPAGGRGLFAAAPAFFSNSFTPLTQWLRTPEGVAAIKADPPLRHFLKIDPGKLSGQAALAPLIETIPQAVLSELSSIEILDEKRREAALAALAEARHRASAEVERRVSAAVLSLQADPESLSPSEMRSLENEAGRLALYSPAGRIGEKSVRRLRTERLMREGGRIAAGLRLDWDSDDFSPAASDAVVSGGTSTPGKIVLRLTPPKRLPPSAYFDGGHWKSDLVPDASYRRHLSAAAALFAPADAAASAAAVQAHRARRTLTDSMRELDPKIYSHMMRVGLLAGMIAYQMGHSLEYSGRVAWGARIHDIGKREEPTLAVVNKAGRLDAAERAVMERHPEVGAAIISLERSLDPLSRRVGMRVALNHHETSDGSGYPRRLKGDEIPLEARITTIADFYDALMDNRPYRAGMNSAAAVAIMSKSAHKFDPVAWKAFLVLMASAGAAKG